MRRFRTVIVVAVIPFPWCDFNNYLLRRIYLEASSGGFFSGFLETIFFQVHSRKTWHGNCTLKRLLIEIADYVLECHLYSCCCGFMVTTNSPVVEQLPLKHWKEGDSADRRVSRVLMISKWLWQCAICTWYACGRGDARLRGIKSAMLCGGGGGSLTPSIHPKKSLWGKYARSFPHPKGRFCCCWMRVDGK